MAVLMGVLMRTLGDIVKHVHWLLGREALYKCSPFKKKMQWIYAMEIVVVLVFQSKSPSVISLISLEDFNLGHRVVPMWSEDVHCV